MNGDKTKKGGYGLRNNAEREMDKEVPASKNPTGQDGGCTDEALNSTCKVVNEAVATGMAVLKRECAFRLKNKWTNSRWK